MNPVPVSVQRKEQADAEALYQQVRQALEQGQPRLLELTCEKVEGKKVTLLISEVLAVQLYEKTAATGGSKRPGFSVEP
jgi:phage shock protein A|tara:strand:+ start:219 stop:455 length:237 start_codon:yes stop_codon:yes gene_type:complete